MLINILKYFGYIEEKKTRTIKKRKSKKKDNKRIALGQSHERQYLKKIAKEQLEKLEQQDGNTIWGNAYLGKGEYRIIPKKDKCSKAKLTRITKALLKYLERDKR